jgi:hypothetical protein
MRSPAPGRGAVLLFHGTLAWLLCWFVIKRAISPSVAQRLSFVEQVLRGEMEPPYQFRLLEHGAAALFTPLARALASTPAQQHVLAYGASLFFCLLGVQLLLGRYLSAWFTRPTALLGQALFTALVPLSVTGFFVEGDFFTLLFYLGGLVLYRAGRDAWLPLLVAVGALNREQSVFLLVLYAAALLAEGRWREPRRLVILAASFASFAAVYLGLRAAFGFPQSRYTWALHIANNTDPGRLLGHVLPLWLAEVLGLVALAALALPRASRSLRLAFACLGPYLLLYFLHGNLWELAKFLPAHLLLLPLALQALTGEAPDTLGPPPPKKAAAIT